MQTFIQASLQKDQEFKQQRDALQKEYTAKIEKEQKKLGQEISKQREELKTQEERIDNKARAKKNAAIGQYQGSVRLCLRKQCIRFRVSHLLSQRNFAETKEKYYSCQVLCYA